MFSFIHRFLFSEMFKDWCPCFVLLELGSDETPVLKLYLLFPFFDSFCSIGFVVLETNPTTGSLANTTVDQEK